MRFYRRIAGILAAVFVTMQLFPVQVLAAGPIDRDQGCTMTISFRDGDTPLSGAGFSAYRVASADEDGELTVTEEFARYNVNIQREDDQAWKTLASTLEGYVRQDNIAPVCSGSTDSDGLLSLPSKDKPLAAGLYLVLGSRHQQNGCIYDAKPFLAMLPVLDKDVDDWNYNGNFTAKFSSHPVPTGPDKNTVTRKVLKVWKDQGHEKVRPVEVVVHLLQDGEVSDTVVLNAENNWRYVWDDLDSGHQWTMTEDVPGGYTVEITREGVTFVVTNTWGKPGNPPSGDSDDPPSYSDTPPSDSDNPSNLTELFDDLTPLASLGLKLPQTGQLWWPVPMLVCAGLLCILTGIIRRRRL